jgi:hypothetical protein
MLLLILLFLGDYKEALSRSLSPRGWEPRQEQEKGFIFLIPLNGPNHLGSSYHQAHFTDKETEVPKGGMSSPRAHNLSGRAEMKGQVTRLQSPHSFNQPVLPLCLAGR